MDFKQIKTLFSFPLSVFYINRLDRKLDDLLVLNGRQLAQQNNLITDQILNNIHLSEFKVFSQWGDDGIIQFLIHYLDMPSQTFVEFGVEDYKEANTRFLLMNNNWRGLVMDGSEKNVNDIKSQRIYWRNELTALHSFVTKENINDLLTQSGFAGELGILHIDIDGNDYWIWQEVSVVHPVVVIMEYNSVFGPTNPWTVPYNKDFYRTNAHYSNLFYGSSLTSLCDLAESKGYAFIGCTTAGNNAYFVRKDKMKQLQALSPSQGYVRTHSREARNSEGKLTFANSSQGLQTLKGMQVYNTRTQQLEVID